MKIYTKTGDAGTTGLFAGPRVFKDDSRIVAYGSVDELNALLGVVQAMLPEPLRDQALVDKSWSESFHEMQSDLFAMGAELATPDPDGNSMRLLSPGRVLALEAIIDRAEHDLPPLANFIMPGGVPVAAYLHLARTVCRRAERELVGLIRQPDTADYSLALIYLNRLGDLLFVLARLANSRCGGSESIWRRPE
ncbi:MAG: cob(I)yrinic acid a,c-diamide adenosyltransferase [Pirellulaceae bacterium]|nr:cob(I)yrinic acid a,c-diamide adenosyltransferase [Pirellulaceae bacterium]